MSRFKLYAIAIPISLFCAGVAHAQASGPPHAVTREVNVYFVYEGSDATKAGELFGLKRKVSRVAPLRGALEWLIGGPTAAEATEGYQSVAYAAGMKLASAKIKRGIAYAYFTRPAIQGSAPDLASLRFEDAVIRTAKQFRGVKRVVVCVNGQIEFGIGMVENVPRPCPREVK